MDQIRHEHHININFELEISVIIIPTILIDINFNLNNFYFHFCLLKIQHDIVITIFIITFPALKIKTRKKLTQGDTYLFTGENIRIPDNQKLVNMKNTNLINR